METDNGKGIEMHTIDFVNNSLSILNVELKDIKIIYEKISVSSHRVCYGRL